VTSGFLAQHTSDPLIFRSVGPGLNLNGFDNHLSALSEEFGVFWTCCHFGEPIDMSARVSRQLGDGVNVMFSGVSYAQVWRGGELRFDAPSVTLPAALTVNTLEAPFVLSGQLSAFATPARTGTPLFSTGLVGAGVASLGLLHVDGGDLVGIGDLDYTINASAPTPTPEPTTLTLLIRTPGYDAGRRVQPSFGFAPV